MQRLEVSGGVRPIYRSLGVERISTVPKLFCLATSCILPSSLISRCFSWIWNTCFQILVIFISPTARSLAPRTEIRLTYKCNGKGKGKVNLTTAHEGPEGKYMYCSTLSLTLALDEVGGQHHILTALPTIKTRYPLYRRLSGAQGQSGQVGKISSPTGNRSLDRLSP